jgi:hypothetical protein
MIDRRRHEHPGGASVTTTELSTPEVGPGDLPGHAVIDETCRVVHDHADRIFTWSYERERTPLVTLYNKAASSQWNGVTDLDWSTEVDPEQVFDPHGPVMVLARTAAAMPGSPLRTWGEKEFTQLGVETLKASLSQFMHGEQGAMMTAAKLVETVPWIDAKYYAATQTMDEARHTDVFARYLSTKVGEAYPMSPYLQAQIFGLLEDPRWDIAYLGMQIIIESLALAAFGDMLRRTEEPLLKKLLRYVMSDEARHVAFGIVSLSELYRDLSQAELKERQEFLADNTARSRFRSTTPEVWERLGVSVPVVMPYIEHAATSLQTTAFPAFQRGFFSKLVPNVRKLGLLDANRGWLREQWGKQGLMEFEHADDTASDYEAYDVVRAGIRSAGPV